MPGVCMSTAGFIELAFGLRDPKLREILFIFTLDL